MDEFADFFISKILKIRHELEKYPLYQPSMTNAPEFNQFNKLDEEQVMKLIMNTKSKSCELDPIPTTLLKSILPSILSIITNFINQSLQSGSFIRNWKTAIVTPLIIMYGMDLVKSSFRPLSNLSYVSKLVEKAMMDQMNQHCNTNNLLPDYQFAYREHRSCEPVLLKLTSDLLWSMEKKNVTVLIALYLSMAFDTVDHSVLLTTLQSNFGINGTALDWFKNNFTPRNMKIKIVNTYSDEKDLTFSVPQGLCSRANLFNMYSRTICKEINSSLNLNGFADNYSIMKEFNPNLSVEEIEKID